MQVVYHLCKIFKLVFRAFPHLKVVEFLFGFATGMK